MIRVRHLNFDWQIGLIVVTAILGLAVAFNPVAARFQFAVILCAVALYFIAANLHDPMTIRGRIRSVLSSLMIGLPVVIALYFLLTNDWARWIGKIPLLDPLLKVLAGWPLSSGRLSVNPNVVGGALAALLPLQIYALRHTRRSIQVVTLLVTVTALGLSQTRGAWLALLLVTGMWFLWRQLSKRIGDLRRTRTVWLVIVIGAGAILLATLIATPLGNLLLGFGGDRRIIWQNSVDLIGDYPVTGLGLAGFEMAYSSYALLVHVGHTTHAHDLWLDMWLNQGLVGVMALLGMVANAVWPRSTTSLWRMPALLALGVMLLHSLTDDPYYGYGGIALPLLFLPLGLLARSDGASPIGTGNRSRFQPAFAVWGVAALALIVGLSTTTGRAALAANVGTLSQTQAELSVYHWPEVPLQDALRRSDAVDLSLVVRQYQTALTIDAANAPALRRLGQIELARGEYAQACQHFAAAYAAQPWQRATRQLLAECKALNAQPEEAQALWNSIDTSQGQLFIRLYWYNEYLSDHERGAKLAALGEK